MELHLQVTHLDKRISLSEALKSEYVKIIDNYMIAQEGTSLSLSSRLYDCNGNELFEHDIVQTTNGKQYVVIYDFGLFYLKGIKDKTMIPIYIYKLGNTSDVEKV